MENGRLLIVEDEPKVAGFIKKGLEENGFTATVAYDGLMGKALALNETFNLIILDINLPHLNGFQLCKIIREKDPKVPILMLTALGSIDEKIKGFEQGADDYLLKPFDFKELLARIKSLLKRIHPEVIIPSIIRIANLELNKDEKTVKRNDKTIELSAKEYALLEYLALNKGKVISRSELTEQVWGMNFDTGTNVVDVYINFLRKKMDNDYFPKLIHTKVGVGYMLKIQEE